jgi:glycosyltransferase involved in cell wall biosynthesis
MPPEHTPRIAWLFPSLERGNYWHPILSELTRMYPQTHVFTGVWSGYSQGYENGFAVEVVGKMRFVDTAATGTGYNKGFIYASPKIIGRLLSFRPDLIFTTGFCMWTIFALLLKPIAQWRVVITYDGSSPGVDYRGDRLRAFARRLMGWAANGFITNSQAGKAYLQEQLGVSDSKIFARPYQVPDITALLQPSDRPLPDPIHRPVFLYIGQLIPRKGLQQLLAACRLLQEQGCDRYTLWVIGDGAQRQELQAFSQQHQLEESVHWLGWVEYSQLGAYLQTSDVFVFPTLEDIWGMVLLEAMAFGKPVVSSRWAGASELVIEGENGYLIDPYQPEEIASAMRQLIDHPERISSQGDQSRTRMTAHTSPLAAQFLAKVTDVVLHQ